MGFFSSIGSGISSVCSSVGNAISNAFSSASSACSSVLSSVASITPAITGALKALSVAMPYIKAAITVIDISLKIIGLLRSDETVEEIGDRVLQAREADIIPENFSNYDEYMAEIRSFKLDPEKSKKFNLGEKVAAGVSVQAWGMEETFGENSSDLLGVIIKDAVNLDKGEGYFTEARVASILKAVDNYKDLADFFTGKVDADTRNDIEAKIVAAEHTLNPDKPIEEIYKQLDKQIED